ncbi:MAG: sulfate adenylyltransferase small subunit [Lentisphaerae bacterium GWF2_45_14]|nr:MAG: sulfate adenylyltransferase small subunit [Lentisphaerae bacterium GWF2_45_14]
MSGKYNLNHLKQLESESIHIMREVASEFERPVMLYSIGKDSSVMLRLAEKAFYPGKIPFPLMHVDTGFKFKEMYEFRDTYIKEIGAELIIYRNEKSISEKMNPYDYGTQKCCSFLKTQALVDSIRAMKFDVAFGGARRDEEKSRAKERIYSFRDESGQWDPKNQRPELWDIYNGKINKGQSIRVFPLSNWTELDVWNYIYLEKIPIVPLYFAKEREMVVRDGQLIPCDGPVPLGKNEKTTKIMSRFRTLGCYPCTGAIKSTAATVPDIIQEMMTVTISERSTRIIDHDAEGSMEDKKKEGYF